MISHLRVLLNFDPEALKRDLDQLASHEWVAHFNTDYFEGDWCGVALRSVGGLGTQLYSHPNVKESFAATPILSRCPNIRAVLEQFQCPLRSVRFLKLAAGSIIREHRDSDLGFERGEVRFHVPVISNPDVVFFLDAHRVEMKAGECWYLDLSLPHWVENRGSSDRIHLVIDCELNEWLRELLATAQVDQSEKHAAPTPDDKPSSPEELERFRGAVLGDLNLQQQLRVTADWESFARLAVEIGKEHGYRFQESHVEAALLAARQEWLSKWFE
jgi:hypothetical protein